MLVCNSGEEGLGDLKGCKRLFADFAGRIGRFITFDCQPDVVCDRCVGSHRYRVQVQTEGGHSFGDFGKDNAIALLAQLVSDIYQTEVPQKADTHTTYNVGLIEGGTSVNTIAQSATMLCEYRSDDVECLRQMQARFEGIFEAARARGVQLQVDKVGDRPCADIGAQQERFADAVVPVIERCIGQAVTRSSASTDCNVPLSLGIPALCIGIARYAGMHTRQEWVDKASMRTGLHTAIAVALAL
jgi:di/tripeptidase